MTKTTGRLSILLVPLLIAAAPMPAAAQAGGARACYQTQTGDYVCGDRADIEPRPPKRDSQKSGLYSWFESKKKDFGPRPQVPADYPKQAMDHMMSAVSQESEEAQAYIVSQQCQAENIGSDGALSYGECLDMNACISDQGFTPLRNCSDYKVGSKVGPKER